MQVKTYDTILFFLYWLKIIEKKWKRENKNIKKSCQNVIQNSCTTIIKKKYHLSLPLA